MDDSARPAWNAGRTNDNKRNGSHRFAEHGPPLLPEPVLQSVPTRPDLGADESPLPGLLVFLPALLSGRSPFFPAGALEHCFPSTALPPIYLKLRV